MKPNTLNDIIQGLQIIYDYDNTSIIEAADCRIFVEVWTEKLEESKLNLLKSFNWIIQEDGIVYYT